DMSYCSAYMQPICSLCCSLDVRCLESCKPHARLSNQVIEFLYLFLPRKAASMVNSRLGRFMGLLLACNLLNGALMAVVYRQMKPATEAEALLLGQTIWTLFFTFLIVSGVLTWLFLLAHESRVVAQEESNRQTKKLTMEIEAHKKTDLELQQAKELAERSNDAKSRYLTGISHELRTPLQSILGYAQLLSEKPETPSQHRNGLEIIHRSGQYLTDLIEGLLDISKIEAGRLDLYRSRVQLPQLIEQLASMFRMQAEAKGIVFKCSVHDALPNVIITDEKRLRQILINLLSNAVKYTPEGQVNFDIHYRNQVAEFSITDTGPGIPPDQLKRIFDPFERVRNADTANLPGTGLGLTIVKLLTEIMGGDLQVDSTQESGSCFKVSLMLPWVNNAEVFEDRRQQIAGYEGYERTICLVDDDPILRGLLSDLLNPCGFKTLEAHDAEACLALLEKSQPDLFLLDVSMPGMNGLELARALRQRQLQVPIIMLSADAQEHDRDPQYQSSYDDYLVKPVSNHKLLDKLAQHLKLEWTYQEMAAAIPAVTFKPVVAGHMAAGHIAASSEQITIPDHSLILELKAFAEMGYRKGVQESLARIADEAILCGVTQSHLEQLCKNFQFEQLAHCLEQKQS
ncbi:MAG: ATP-binding protein, partial [Motiliproteus sp.]